MKENDRKRMKNKMKENVRDEMNCAVMTKAIFLSRSARHVRHTTSPLHSDRDTTHN